MKSNNQKIELFLADAPHLEHKPRTTRELV